MPSFPRERCRDTQELHLWDECKALALEVARYRSLLDSISRCIADSRSQDRPSTRVEAAAAKSVGSAGAARARCYRRGLSDEARRRALERARELGALPPDFDESVLPWKGASSVSKPDPEARHAQPSFDLLALRPDLLPHDEAEQARLIADRLARLEYRKGTRHTAPLPSVASWGAVTHGDGTLAVLGDQWSYTSGQIARQGPLFFRPGGLSSLDIARPGALQEYRRHVLTVAAHTFGNNVADETSRGLATLTPPLQVLALLELELECRALERDLATEQSASRDG